MPPNLDGSPKSGEPGYIAPVSGAGTNVPGLINTTPANTTGNQVTGFTPAQTIAKDAQATPFTVAPNQTVSSQLRGVIDENSPLLQKGVALANQDSNSRGLLNSSMATTAAQDALYRTALPIATADAGTYDRAATNTAQAQNQATLQNASLGTNVNLANAGATNAALSQTAGAANVSSLSGQQAAQSSKLQAEQAQQASTLSAQGATQQEAIQAKAIQGQKEMQNSQIQSAQLMQTVDAANKVQLTNIEADYKTLMQTSATAGDIYKGAMNAMTQIMADPNMDGPSKQTALNNQTAVLKNSLAFISSINGVDMTGLI